MVSNFICVTYVRHKFLFKLSLTHQFSDTSTFCTGECGGSVVEHQTPEQEVGGSKPTSAVLCL